LDIVILAPLFYYAEPDGLNGSLEKISFLNAQGHYYISWIVFFFTVLYSMMGHIFLFFYEEKRQSLNIQTTRSKDITEEDISKHSLMVRGISKTVPIERVQQWTRSVFSHILDNNLIRAHAIGDYTVMNILLRKLQKTLKRKVYYKDLYDQTKEAVLMK